MTNTQNVPSSFRPIPKPTAPTAPPKSISTAKHDSALQHRPSAIKLGTNGQLSETKSLNGGGMGIGIGLGGGNASTPIPSSKAATDDEIDQINMKKLINDQMMAYHVPWKPPNDYEALETNTVTGMDF